MSITDEINELYEREAQFRLFLKSRNKTRSHKGFVVQEALLKLEPYQFVNNYASGKWRNQNKDYKRSCTRIIWEYRQWLTKNNEALFGPGSKQVVDKAPEIREARISPLAIFYSELIRQEVSPT